MSYFDILVLLVFRPWPDCGSEVHLEPFSRKNQIPSNDPSIKKSNFGIFVYFWSKSDILGTFGNFHYATF